MELKAVVHLGRFKDIVLILLKYGFEDVVERLDLPGKVLIEKIQGIDPGVSTAKRIRLALEELGPTFIKFGQVLSMRPDVIPAPVIEELRKLQDEVPPVPYRDIRKVVEENLGRPLDEIFFRFEKESIAAASLAQVHRAILRKDRLVAAVKVQRPGIHQLVNNDLYILYAIARRLHDRMESLKIYDLPELVIEFKRALLRELHFTREARHMKIARRNLGDSSEISIPQVYDEYSTDQVLVMELIEGTKLKDLPPDAPVDREVLAKNGLRATIKQVLEDGFFHADPHPGNLLIGSKGELCLLDWGMVGRLTEPMRFDLIDIIMAFVERDSVRLLDAILHVVRWESDINKRLLQRDLLDIIDGYHDIPLEEVNIGQMMMELTGLLREYRLKIPMDMAIMIKALATSEGVARQLYPGLDVIAEAEPYLTRLSWDRWNPQRMWKDLRRGVRQILDFQKELPANLSRILTKVERGDLSIQFRHRDLDDIRLTLEKITSRLTSGIIIAAMIIGSSMIITTGVGPFLFGFPALGVMGYIISAVLGLGLIFNIIRTRSS